MTELIAELTRDMLEAADRLEFERAAYLRDQITQLKKGSSAKKGASVRRKGTGGRSA